MLNQSLIGQTKQNSRKQQLLMVVGLFLAAAALFSQAIFATEVGSAHDYAHIEQHSNQTIPLPQFDLTTTVNGPTNDSLGSVILEPPGGRYASGTKVMLAAAAEPNAQFAEWGGSCRGSAPICMVTMDANQSVTATFTLKPLARYQLKTHITGNGRGLILLEPPTGTYIGGTIVSATAQAEANSTFVGWSGGCSGNQSCVLMMDGNKAITATFSSLQIGSNSQPVAMDDEVSTGQSDPLTIDLVANDYDGDGDLLTVHEIGQPSDATGVIAGTLLLSGSLVTFTPMDDFSGLATFDYSLSDGHGGSDIATVTIRVVKESILLPMPERDRMSHSFESTISVQRDGFGDQQPNTTGHLGNVLLQTFIDVPVGAIPPQRAADSLALRFGWPEPGQLTQPQRDAFPSQFRGALLTFVIDAIVAETTQQEYGFGTPIKIAFGYDSALWDAADEPNLAVRYWSSSAQQWQNDGVHIIQHDLGNNLIVLEINHLTQFALFALPTIPQAPTEASDPNDLRAPNIYLPLIR